MLTFILSYYVIYVNGGLAIHVMTRVSLSEFFNLLQIKLFTFITKRKRSNKILKGSIH